MTRWERCALPTLRALRDSGDVQLRDGFLSLGRNDRGSRALRLDVGDGELFDVLFQLRDLGYVEFREPEVDSGPGATFVDLRLTGRGMQVLGEWPRFEALVSPITLAQAVERLAEFAPSEDQRSRIRAVAAYLRRLGPKALRSAAAGATAQLIRAQVGL